VRVPEVDERPSPGENPRTHVQRLAAAKARSAAGGLRAGLVIAADTVVVLDGNIIGKPRDQKEAARILSLLSGRTHNVYSGLAVMDALSGKILTKVVRSRVTMNTLKEREIARYVESGEPCDKAGAYAAQGRGRLLIAGVEGSYTNVVGLPLPALRQLLEKFGCEVPPSELT
jgi:septum formation protein